MLGNFPGRVKSDWGCLAGVGAFRTLRLARDFVEIGSWFWLMGGGFWKMARLGNGMRYENTS